ncbi:MAG: hypothetical protein M3410_08390 [Acidobacteriota bacterium]|nr:hypothetical protein [Acidobacteriota bacterium]
MPVEKGDVRNLTNTSGVAERDYNQEGEWDVENSGVAPDIEVELDPKAWRQGHDLQLEKAVEVVMDALRKNPAPEPRKPAYPNYHRGTRAKQ